jgi:hypothetical protein
LERDFILARHNDRRGIDRELAKHLDEARKRLRTQQDAILDTTEKIAYDLRNAPPDGDFAALMSNWFRELESAVAGLNVRPVLNALAEYAKKKSVEYPADTAAPGGRAEAQQAQRSSRRRRNR